MVWEATTGQLAKRKNIEVRDTNLLLECVLIVVKVVGTGGGVRLVVRSASMSLYRTLPPIISTVSASSPSIFKSYVSFSVVLFTEFSALWVDSVLSTQFVGLLARLTISLAHPLVSQNACYRVRLPALLALRCKSFHG